MQNNDHRPASHTAYLMHLHWHLVDEIDSLRVASSTLTCELCRALMPRHQFAVLQTECEFGGGRLLRYRCPHCEVIFGAEKMLRLSPAQLGREYEAHYSVYSEGDSTEAEMRAFYALQPKREGCYVNFGAGAWSRSVALLRSEGWNVFAFEPHASATAGAAEDWLIRDWGQLMASRFNGLFSNNVLEHFRYPVAELARLKGLLVPGGQMAHATPCYEYLYEYTRFHLFFYTGHSRHVLWQMAGLQEVGWEVDGHYMCSVTQPI